MLRDCVKLSSFFVERRKGCCYTGPISVDVCVGLYESLQAS